MANERLAAIQTVADRYVPLIEILSRKGIEVSDADVEAIDDAVSALVVTLAKYDTRGEQASNMAPGFNSNARNTWGFPIGDGNFNALIGA